MDGGNGLHNDAFLYLGFDRDLLEKSGVLWMVAGQKDQSFFPEKTFYLNVPDFEVLRDCRSFFKPYSGIFLAIADDELRADVAEAVEEYLPTVKLYLPANGAFCGYASVRELAEAGGEAALERLATGTTEKAVHGLVSLAAVKRPEKRRGTLSGIPELDSTIGGFDAGELSIWTGKRGGGKSTLLSQIMLEAVEQSRRVCVYSGELSAWNFKKWAQLQAAGAQHLNEAVSEYSGQRFYTVPADVAARIDAWWDGHIWLYDNSISGGSEADSILRVFRMAVLRYGCDVFIVDNLMSSRFTNGSDKDFYRAQSNFVGELVQFAKEYGSHVHVVAHPRKTDNGRALNADDVGGSGDITNRADNVFSLTRLEQDKAVQEGCSAKLQILKNRAFGADGYVPLWFDDRARRFYSAKSGNAGRRFSWG